MPRFKGLRVLSFRHWVLAHMVQGSPNGSCDIERLSTSGLRVEKARYVPCGEAWDLARLYLEPSLPGSASNS